MSINLYIPRIFFFFFCLFISCLTLCLQFSKDYRTLSAESKCHNFLFLAPDFRKETSPSESLPAINAINPMCPLKSVEVSARKFLLNGSIFVEGTGTFQKKSRMRFYVFDLSPPGSPVRHNVWENVLSSSDISQSDFISSASGGPNESLFN